MITRMGVLLVAVVLCATSSVANARRTTVDMGSGNVDVRESSDETYGDYFVIDVQVPQGISGAALMGAILEFYLDVDIRIDSVLVEEQDTSYTVVHRNPVPLLEMFALTSTARSTLDPTQWDETLAFPAPIGLGTNRIVRINITRLVKHYLEHPEANHGLIVGSLSGRRPGHFSLKETFGSGVLARIRYIY